MTSVQTAKFIILNERCDIVGEVSKIIPPVRPLVSLFLSSVNSVMENRFSTWENGFDEDDYDHIIYICTRRIIRIWDARHTHCSDPEGIVIWSCH